MRTLLFVAAVLLIVPGRLAAADLSYDALNRALTERVVLPAYEKLVPAMETLARVSEAFCADPANGHARLLDAFHGAMDAWQHAQPISFGPVASEGRASRIEFWPDSGGSTDRQIRRALAERDPALIADGGLEGKSVALQNLATFERLLAQNAARLSGDGEARPQDRYACAWMTGIARFQVDLARIVADEWKNGFAEAVTSAGSGNATYADARGAATDFLKSLAGALDVIVTQKLERPMGATVAKARASRAESWRTKRSLANIVANLETARDLFSVPDGFGDLLAAAGSGPLADGMRDNFETAIATARSIGAPLEDAVADTGTRPKLEELLRQIKALRTLIAGPVASDIGLVVGFNALDGD